MLREVSLVGRVAHTDSYYPPHTQKHPQYRLHINHHHNVSQELCGVTSPLC